jgi:deoxyribodipyrimidine photolyase-related protein
VFLISLVAAPHTKRGHTCGAKAAFFLNKLGKKQALLRRRYFVKMKTRNLILILGDQLDRESAALRDADKKRDVIVMIEAREESTHVWSSKVRTALFLSAMRHHAQWLQAQGFSVHYRKLETEKDLSLAAGLAAEIALCKPAAVICVEPGDLRVTAMLQDTCAARSLPLDIRVDTHFLCTQAEFMQWAGSNKSLRMEFFYRVIRRKYNVLMQGEAPEGGQWNYDAENRKSFGKAGPQNVPSPRSYKHDAETKEVLARVEKEFTQHPGNLANFNWPVTREEALIALDDFIEKRLAGFGDHQDAMWTQLAFGWHSLLSTSLNLKLLNPREVIAKAEQAYRAGKVDLASAEGFIRQVLGWREFMRGVYFLDMPAMKTANHFAHTNPLPKWYWTGDTKMNCMKQCIGQTLDYGYAHHIQRLMITGMFGVTAEIIPQEMADWYLAVYVDAIEWVELPNVAGMALFANGGRFTSKPYVASGAYVKRMSNYCSDCAYTSDEKSGANACPVTTLYWNFIDKHEKSLAKNPRTALMAKNLTRMDPGGREAMRSRAKEMLADLDSL